MAIDLTKYQEAGTLPTGEKLYLDPTTGLNTTADKLTSNTINSASLAPQTPINVPPPPTPSDYPNITGTTQATIDAYANSLKQIQPQSLTEQYKALLEDPGYLAKEANYQKSKGELDTLNAQLEGLKYQSNTVIPNQMQQNATGRGITAAGLEPITAAAQRQKLLEIAPIQYQALLKQAEVTNNESLYVAAQHHLDNVFAAMEKDATNVYNYKKDLIDKAFTYATEKEKEILATQKEDLTKNNTDYNSYINDVQTAITQAREGGNPKLSGEIATLLKTLPDPNSKTFKKDYEAAINSLAAYQTQIRAKPTQEEKNQGAIVNITSQLTKAKGKDGYTNPDIYAQLRAASPLPGSDFDNRFAYLVNPTDRLRLGITGAQAGSFGSLTPSDQTKGLNYLLQNGGSQDDISKFQTDRAFQAWVLNKAL